MLWYSSVSCFRMLPTQYCLLLRIHVRLGWFYKPLIMSREMLAGLSCLSKALNVSSNEALLFSGAVNTLFWNWGLVSTKNQCRTFHDLLIHFITTFRRAVEINIFNWNTESTPTSREVRNGRKRQRLNVCRPSSTAICTFRWKHLYVQKHFSLRLMLGLQEIKATKSAKIFAVCRQLNEPKL